MWIYLNNAGQVITQLNHGNFARQGGTGFELFVCFNNKDVSPYVATVTLKDPNGDSVAVTPVMDNAPRELFNKLPSEANTGAFINGDVYRGKKWISSSSLYFALSGNYEMSVSLYDGDNNKIVEGLITIPVEASAVVDTYNISETQFSVLMEAIMAVKNIAELALIDLDFINGINEISEDNIWYHVTADDGEFYAVKSTDNVVALDCNTRTINFYNKIDDSWVLIPGLNHNLGFVNLYGGIESELTDVEKAEIDKNSCIIKYGNDIYLKTRTISGAHIHIFENLNDDISVSEGIITKVRNIITVNTNTYEMVFNTEQYQFYDKETSDSTFMSLSGNQDIKGAKTFLNGLGAIDYDNTLNSSDTHTDVIYFKMGTRPFLGIVNGVLYIINITTWAGGAGRYFNFTDLTNGNTTKRYSIAPGGSNVSIQYAATNARIINNDYVLKSQTDTQTLQGGLIINKGIKPVSGDLSTVTLNDFYTNYGNGLFYVQITGNLYLMQFIGSDTSGGISAGWFNITLVGDGNVYLFKKAIFGNENFGYVMSNKTRVYASLDLNNTFTGTNVFDNSPQTNESLEASSPTTKLATIKYIQDNVQAELTAHKNNTSNPHDVTKSQVGLGNVDNVQQIPMTYLNPNNEGYVRVAALDSQGKVPTSQIPDALLGQVKFGGTLYIFDSDTTKINYNLYECGVLDINEDLKIIAGLTTVTSITVNGISAFGSPGAFISYSDYIDNADAIKVKGFYFIVNKIHTANGYISANNVSMTDKTLKLIKPNTQSYTLATNVTDGDWLIQGSYLSSYFKIDNTDAVKSVNGHVGVVDLTKRDLGLEYIETDIAPYWDSANTYVVGDLVIYNGKLYKCIVNIPTPENNFVPFHWQSTSVKNVINSLKTTIEVIKSKMPKMKDYVVNAWTLVDGKYVAEISAGDNFIIDDDMQKVYTGTSASDNDIIGNYGIIITSDETTQKFTLTCYRGDTAPESAVNFTVSQFGGY